MALKITVIGTGYLGATHAAAMAELGFEVLGLDVVPEKIEMLQRGEVPMYEPGLEELLRKHVAGIEGSTGRLRFTMDWAEVGEFGDVHFVCVNTPQKHGEYACDMSFVDSAFGSLAPHLRDGALVVGKSIYLQNNVTNSKFRTVWQDNGLYQVKDVDPRVLQPSDVGDIARAGYQGMSSPYQIQDSKIVTTVGNAPFEITVYKVGGKYFGARSNEFGFANYEMDVTATTP